MGRLYKKKEKSQNLQGHNPWRSERAVEIRLIVLKVK